jgi:hypothetical protein
MKIAILYTVWTGDDMQMLKKSIEQHAPYFDGLCICFQNLSNKGNMNYSGGIPSISSDIDTFYISFTPDLRLNTKENERIKHDLMIQEAKKKGYTHFVLSACDHFYNGNQIILAKEWHLKNPEIEVSLTKMITYYKNDNWCLFPLEKYCMPFIHVIQKGTQISRSHKYPVVVDPSVMVNASKFKVFQENEVILHHYSMIRTDIKKKFNNAAASIRWTEKQINKFIDEYENAKIGDEISYFNGLKLVEKEFVLKQLENK